MARLFLILIAILALATIVWVFATIGSRMITAGTDRLQPTKGPLRDADMASSGIQKAAYIALIIVLFGVASGWLGGL